LTPTVEPTSPPLRGVTKQPLQREARPFDQKYSAELRREAFVEQQQEAELKLRFVSNLPALG